MILTIFLKPMVEMSEKKIEGKFQLWSLILSS